MSKNEINIFSKIKRRRKGKNKKGKVVGILILSIVLYIILGALLPFVNMKKIEEEFKQSFNKSIYYGEKNKISFDRAAIIEDSQSALDIRINMLNEAEKSIVLSTFDIRSGKSSDDIFSTIQAAANRGVKVQILVDGMYGGLHMYGEPMFYGIGTNPNIEIRFYNPPNLLKPWTVNGRMHDKYIIVDNKYLILGGRNTFDYFLGEYNEKKLSYDRDILVYNTEYKKNQSESVINEVQEYFEHMWNLEDCKTVFDKENKKSHEKVKKAVKEMEDHYKTMVNSHSEWMEPVDYTEFTVPVNKITFIHNPTHIFSKEPYVWFYVQQFMKEAKERAVIHTPYAALSKEMYTEIAEIANNVEKFEMLLNSTAVGDNFMASSDYTMHRKKILKTGIEIFEFQGKQSSHGKSFLIDNDISMIGSYNLDMRSTYVNTEVMLVVHGEEFNSLLQKNIQDMKESSLKVLKDGTYEERNGVHPVELSTKKKILFGITSVAFQLFRYLI